MIFMFLGFIGCGLLSALAALVVASVENWDDDFIRYMIAIFALMSGPIGLVIILMYFAVRSMNGAAEKIAEKFK